MLRHALFGLMLTAGLALPGPASAASNTVVGVGSGAVAGALVAGPIGAVAGAVIGGVVGSSSERARRPRMRRARLVRQRRAEAPARRSVQRRVEAVPPAGSAPTTWKDPR
ncbi:hypothetical protein MKK70_28800 [Methylobacterium sp. E-041]|uniref:hypothetical protein n=1 Tax=unclassified Methylobacterium TaxID=2615210 RepID=UPI001FBB4D7A|nr:MULTISPECIES: hypothetical protein [unclassified Methylobacterium]MCJ2038743.1 hypothetical protein [Methylobacterium sp. J-059]MCJ2109293.1 hypothetical protein [Methylobacterium sp. E-041]MCJ2111102.1 hypothetical protein [Methylobacterium sp. E-025]